MRVVLSGKYNVPLNPLICPVGRFYIQGRENYGKPLKTSLRLLRGPGRRSVMMYNQKNQGDMLAAARHIPLFSCDNFEFMRIIVVVETTSG